MSPAVARNRDLSFLKLLTSPPPNPSSVACQTVFTNVTLGSLKLIDTPLASKRAPGPTS